MRLPKRSFFFSQHVKITREKERARNALSFLQLQQLFSFSDTLSEPILLLWIFQQYPNSNQNSLMWGESAQPPLIIISFCDKKEPLTDERIIPNRSVSSLGIRWNGSFSKFRKAISGHTGGPVRPLCSGTGYCL